MAHHVCPSCITSHPAPVSISPEEQVELYVKRSFGKEYTPDVLELFANTDCLESFEEEVKQVYKRACCDASFAVTKRLGKVVNAVHYLQQIRLQ